jgi:hypothetical protein
VRAALLVLAATAAFSALAGAASAAADHKNPIAVVELFQSQGCSSCPPANANVIALSDRADLLTLSLGVTYWDDLGWKDTFASPQNTKRQYDYASAFKRKGVFTPEVVVNGVDDVVGNDRGKLEALIQRVAFKPGSGPEVAVEGNAATIGAAASDTASADIWLVRYDPNIVQVPIKRGENGGRTLPHKNVVKEFVKLGEWTGGAEHFDLPAASASGLRQAVLVQRGVGGPILAAAHD